MPQPEHTVIKETKRELDRAIHEEQKAGLPTVTLPASHVGWLLHQAIENTTVPSEKVNRKNEGVNFCPHCGKPTKHHTLPSDLDGRKGWICGRCNTHIEVYIIGSVKEEPHA